MYSNWFKKNYIDVIENYEKQLHDKDEELQEANNIIQDQDEELKKYKRFIEDNGLDFD